MGKHRPYFNNLTEAAVRGGIGEWRRMMNLIESSIEIGERDRNQNAYKIGQTNENKNIKKTSKKNSFRNEKNIK